MKMTELFATKYKEIAGRDDFRTFNKRCRTFGDGLTNEQLAQHAISFKEIAMEVAEGLIKYEPRIGVGGKFSGYSLTHDGIKKVYKLMNH